MPVFASVSNPGSSASSRSPSQGSTSRSPLPSASNTTSSSDPKVSWSYLDPMTTSAFLGSPTFQPFSPNVPGGQEKENIPCATSGTCSGSEVSSPASATFLIPDPQRCQQISPSGSSVEGASLSEDSTADGMTPTPKQGGGANGNSSSTGSNHGSSCHFPSGGMFDSSDSLGDLLDDLDSCLPLGFDMEDLDGETAITSMSASPPPAGAAAASPKAAATPIFKTPAEAAAYLKAPRGDLDMEVQRCLLTYEKSESLNACVNKWQKESQLTESERLASLKILVHEAANRSLSSLKQRSYRRRVPTPPPCPVDCDVETQKVQEVLYRQGGKGGSAFSMSSSFNQQHQQQLTLEEATARTTSAWKSVEENVISDNSIYGYATPQRNLSCMCIFNPALVDTSTPFLRSQTPLPCPYGENDDDRAERSAMQNRTMRTLQLQQTLHERSTKAKDSSDDGSSGKSSDKSYLFIKRNPCAASDYTLSPSGFSTSICTNNNAMQQQQAQQQQFLMQPPVQLNRYPTTSGNGIPRPSWSSGLATPAAHHISL